MSAIQPIYYLQLSLTYSHNTEYTGTSIKKFCSIFSKLNYKVLDFRHVHNFFPCIQTHLRTQLHTYTDTDTEASVQIKYLF